MRKLIICTTIAAMLSGLGTSVFAETNVASNVTDGTAKIQVTSDTKGGVYTVYFLKPGKTAADITDNTDAFAGVEQVALTFGEETGFGTGEISFKLPAEYGTYTAIIGGGELSGKEIKLAYANPTEAADPIAELKAATASTIDSVLTKAEYNGTYWYADTDADAYKTHKSALMEALVENVKTATDSDSVTDAYNKACVIAELKTCTADEVYDMLFVAEPVVGITYGEEVYKKTDAMASAFVKLRATEKLNTPADLTAFLEKAEALGKLNTATRDTIIGIIEGYNGVFKLDLSGDYVKADKYSLAKKLVVTDGNTYDSIAEVQERFEEALEAVIKENSTTTGGTTGGGGGLGLGGGGGGGGGTAVGGNYPTQNPEVVSEDLMDNNTGEFTDLDGAEWAKPYILYLAENNIMTGDGNGSFRPNDKVLREEFLKTLIEALKLTSDEDLAEIAKFNDVDKDAWYAKYIAAGVKLGIVTGKEESLFGIGDEITRQDAAVMIKRAVDGAGLTLYAEKDAAVFTDADSISEYAKEAVVALQKAGIINGYETGEFAPQNSILRSETAKMIYTMLSGINK